MHIRINIHRGLKAAKAPVEDDARWVTNKTSPFSSLATVFIGKAESLGSPQRAVLDMDSTEIPVYAQQENSACHGHFESTCYHPLLLFNREGDCRAAKPRPGNVHSADGWEQMLLPEIELQKKAGQEVVFRARP
jgi:hypothetical protein